MGNAHEGPGRNRASHLCRPLRPKLIGLHIFAKKTQKRAGLNKAQVAERMGTSQSTIARLESGRTLPSLRTLDRYARATGSRAVLRLEAQA